MQGVVLTVDVEEWFQTSGLNVPIEDWSRYESRVWQSTEKILAWVDAHHIRVTWFVLGSIAERYPELVRTIAKGGHEIASHGMRHQMVNRLSQDQFRMDVRESRQLLEDISGQQVVAYRAPSWSIGEGRFAALRILEEEGYRVDSSVQPFATPLSGVRGAPVGPYHPKVEGQALDLLEVPPSVLPVGGAKLGITIPCAGGFYMRALPYPIFRACLRGVTQKRAGVVYVHPWEFDFAQPRLSVPLPVRFVQYLNLRQTESKFLRLLRDNTFITLQQLVEQSRYPVISLGKDASLW